MGLAVKGRTLTILAAPPPDSEDKHEDGAIEAVRKVLEQAAKERNDYSLERAWSIVRLGNVLKADLRLHPKDPPGLVQIIGHGRPGVLFLGATWTRRTSDKDRTYVLECNLNKYGVLGERVLPDTKVLLLGCRLGLLKSTKSIGVADGPALLFALHRMWGAEVSAPNHMVGPGDFEEGVYGHPELLVTARDLRVDDAVGVPDTPRAPDGVATPLRR